MSDKFDTEFNTNQAECSNEHGFVMADAEDEAIDALLTRIGSAEDAEIDYSAMLECIKRQAASEGVYVFSNDRSQAGRVKHANASPARGTRIKRFAQIAMGVAAACVVGLGIAALSMGFNNGSEGGGSNYASNDDPNTPINDVAATESVNVRDPQSPVGTATSDYVEMTPIPLVLESPDATLAPTKWSGTIGTVEFGTLPTVVFDSELVPPSFNGEMEVRTHTRELRITAMGFDGTVCYDCAVVDSAPMEIDVGNAVLSASKDGYVVYWRINNNQYFYICVSGLTYDEVISVIDSYVAAE